MQHCIICGKSIFPTTGIRLMAGQRACHKCARYIGGAWADYVEFYWDWQDLVAFNEYMKKHPEPKKFLSSCCGKMHISQQQDCFVFDTVITPRKKYIPLYFDNLKNHSFLFIPETHKKTIFNEYVYGKLIFTYEMIWPVIKSEVILHSNLRAKARTMGEIEQQVVYELPPDIKGFVSLFDELCIMSQQKIKSIQEKQEQNYREQEYKEEQKQEKEQQQEASPPPAKTSLEEALILFMFNSTDDITVEQLKTQRNRLIKVFHSDADGEDKYAQKINTAYEILKEYVAKNAEKNH